MGLPWRGAAPPGPSRPGASGPEISFDRHGGGVPVPPGRLPLFTGRRPLKRWCYVGVFGHDMTLCAGSVQVAGLPQSFWAVWDRRSWTLHTQTLTILSRRIAVTPEQVRLGAAGSRVELAISPCGPDVEVVTPERAAFIWTRKTPVQVHGHITSGIEVRPFTGTGILDESAGYHARHTAWEWSAGVGTTVDGESVTWNLVRGIHDSPHSSERTVWIDGKPSEVPPVRFSSDLDEVWGADGAVLRFVEEASRRRRDNFGLVRSDYIQPFGRFYGRLPGGIELADDPPAVGVMERHRAVW